MDLPTNINNVINIIDSPCSKKWEIQNPLKNIHNKEDIISDKSLDLPMTGFVIEKSAKALRGIRVIRRKKIKKHRRRKYRKRMKFVFLTRNKRRGVKRERLFQAELWAKVKAAEKFDAEEYVASRIDLLTRERMYPIFMGEVLPEATAREYTAEWNRLKNRKKNMPKLTLD